MCLLSSCFVPRHQFSSYVPSPSPDYSVAKNWAALPDKKDSADFVAPGQHDKQAEAKADVFYIHPTTYYKRRTWNADVNDDKTNLVTDKFPVRGQASVFNESCCVYAPRYRQATLGSFMKRGKTEGQKALDLAYEDVKKSFEYYLAHYNNGRPFIIASHSQGSRHAFRLLNDYIENDSVLRRRMIAAYVIGFTTDLRFKNIPPCDSSSQTGCLISWNTYRSGTKGYDGYVGRNYYCTNPLTWKRDTVYAPKELNHGSLPKTFDRIDTAMADAQIHDELLWTHKPKKKGYLRVLKNYHVGDYNFYYLNIRENVKVRVMEYFSKVN